MLFYTGDGCRGCSLSTAAIEHPDRSNAAEMGARDPAALGDALMLRIEGAFTTNQISKAPTNPPSPW